MNDAMSSPALPLTRTACRDLRKLLTFQTRIVLMCNEQARCSHGIIAHLSDDAVIKSSRSLGCHVALLIVATWPYEIQRQLSARAACCILAYMGLCKVKEVLVAFEASKDLSPISIHNPCLRVTRGYEDAVARVAVLERANRHPC